MKQLQSSITRVCQIENLIYQDGGEFTQFTELQHTEATQELTQNVESVAFAYKKRQNELKYMKSAFKAALDSRKLALEKFKGILLQAAKSTKIQLKTPIASISVTVKRSKQVLIVDFDETCRSCPGAVTIDTKDNVRTTRINKTMLKDHQATGGETDGYEVNEKKTEFPNVRVIGGPVNASIAYDS